MQQYPCIGQWTFLRSRTLDLPCYEDVVTRLKAGDSILDLGCCLGQDLRYMAADGAPTQNMYASDVVPEFWDIGFDLYRDLDSMKARFLEADILNPVSLHAELNGKIDVVLVNSVFHLFDWDRQVEAGKNIVSLSRPGTWVIGYQIGSSLGKASPSSATTGGAAGATGGSSGFFHNPDTWQKLWQQIEKETKTVWEVESSIHDLKASGLEDEDLVWMGPTACRFEFHVRRLDGSSGTS